MNDLRDRLEAMARGRPASKPGAVDVRALRRRMRMTQQTFAARFGFSMATLRHWERGERRPSGAALTLLNVITHQPRAVLMALGSPIPRNLNWLPKPRRWPGPFFRGFGKSDPEAHW